MTGKTDNCDQQPKHEHDHQHPQELGAGGSREVLLLMWHAATLPNAVDMRKRVFLYFFTSCAAFHPIFTYRGALAQRGTILAQ